MDFGGENVVQTFPEVVGNVEFDNWASGVSDQGAIWATEDDYTAWNAIMPTPDTPSRSRSGSEPPNKKTRSTQVSADVQVVANNRSKAIGKMFFKTKLCCKFRAGVCPYVTNCNFAHGIEELRRPPPNWQEIVAAHEEERGVSIEPREEHQIPTLVSSESRGESQRSYKGRHCKKFYMEEGCPYGDNCTFLHDEQSRVRESVAISLSPTVGGGGYASSGNGPYQKPSNWKTRICNKWETTGSCPFGNKCHFAHGITELHKYGGGLVETDGRDASTSPAELKQGSVLSKPTNDTVVVASTLSSPHPEVFHHIGVGGPSQKPTVVAQRVVGRRPIPKWKGPNKISRIYGDWIDDLE